MLDFPRKTGTHIGRNHASCKRIQEVDSDKKRCSSNESHA